MKPSESDRERKPDKRRKASKRYSFHECYHHDAWTGLLTLDGLHAGIYWRIILLCYIRRGSLHDREDAEIAELCHEPLKTFRRVKRALIERGRLEYDEETGFYHDKRAIEEIVASGFFSEKQAENANKRWRKDAPDAPPAMRVVVDNVTPISPENAAILAGSLAEVALKSAGSQTGFQQNQQDAGCQTHAHQYPLPNINLHTSRSVPGRAAQPPGGGGAPIAPGRAKPSEAERAARREQLRQDAIEEEREAARAARTEAGKDEERIVGDLAPSVDRDQHDENLKRQFMPADRTAKRGGA